MDKDESVEAFADKIRKINYHTYELIPENAAANEVIKNEADQRALDAFLNGLTGSVGHDTRVKQPQTFREAIEFAVHVVEEERRPQTAITNPKKVFMASQGGNFDKKNVVCFKCKKKGHFKKDCKKGTNACYNCGMPGHFSKDCRKPKKRQQGGQGQNSQSNNNANSNTSPLNSNQAPNTTAI